MEPEHTHALEETVHYNRQVTMDRFRSIDTMNATTQGFQQPAR